MVDEAPRILAGRYEVGELIGRGGMAEVHIGHDNRLGRTVAIKILRSDLARDPSFQARFRREAQAAAALNHPTIVAVYDTGEDTLRDPATGSISHVPFIVMEYVEGHTVREILHDGNAVPIEEAVEITQGVLSALEYSHIAGIVHRDIKPANVMLTPTGAVKVMDFGIARALADSAATMTQTQAVIGTAQYLSPEQARGESVDARSDIYSTGCLLFELLTGRPPFTGDSPVSVAYQHVREIPPVPSSIAADVPEALDRITLKALAKDRENRYSNAAAFRADLEAAMRGGHVFAGPAPVATSDETQVFAAPVANATEVFPATAQQPVFNPVIPPAVDEEEELEEDEPKSRKALIWTLVGVAIAAIITMIVILSLGGKGDPTPPPVTTLKVPVVENLTKDEAIALIKTTGFTLTPATTEGPSVDVEAGRVVSSDPPAGEAVAADTAISLVISSGPSEVTIPDVSNLDIDTATQTLTRLGLTVKPNPTIEDSPTITEGRVTRTDPETGKGASQGDQVTLFISNGLVTLPDLTNAKKADAEKQLGDLGLVIDWQTEETTKVKADRVISQQPGANMKVSQHSKVTVVVAAKPVPKTFVLRDYANQQLANVQTALSALNLNWGEPTLEFSATVPSGVVIRTNPSAGNEVTEGDTIEIIVSKGPNPGGNPPPNPGGEDDEG